jgi:hypothetical protein
MENLFKPNRLFVGFCALLVVTVLAANFARDQRILEEAKVIGRQQAEWSWPSQGVSTNVDEVQAKILKLTENDAEVEVKAKQKIILQTPDAAYLSKGPSVNAAATKAESAKDEAAKSESVKTESVKTQPANGDLANAQSAHGQSTNTQTTKVQSNNVLAGARPPAGSEPVSDSFSDFKAVITLYKQGGSHVWLIGKVEGQ